MVKDHVEGKVIIVFKPKAEQSEIEKVLGQYSFKKVFPFLENGALNGLYSLTVNPGTEAAELEGLKLRYGNLIAYAELQYIKL